MNRLLIVAGVLGICGGAMNATVSAAPTPIFYTPLENEADSITNLYGAGSGSTPDDDFRFVSGFSGNAFQSSTNTANGGGYAQWNDANMENIFSTWNNSAGITVDHYFLHESSGFAGVSPALNEGMFAIVRRWTGTPNVDGVPTADPTGLRDSYLFTSIQNGSLRIAFANNFDEQFKFTFNGNAANPGAQEYAGVADGIPLLDNTVYRLTMSIGNGEFKVFLDDVNGTDYDNDEPVYVNDSIIPDGYNWNLPPTGFIPSSGTGGQQRRAMTIGSRGPAGNFGGTLRNTSWVDEVKVYNGVYTPAQLLENEEPLLGDHNGDLVVDIRDYVVWRADPASFGGGDGYLDWAENYGNVGEGSGASNAAGAAIPEPTMLALFACACGALVAGRRRSK